MLRTTDAVLSELISTNWFRNVGNEVEQNVKRLSNWKEAIDACSSIEWENFRLDRGNELSEELSAKDLDRYASWNDLALEIKFKAEPLFEKQLKEVKIFEAYPKKLLSCVRWDVLHICLEAEFGNIVQSSFYLNHLKPIYVSGHFPCGWTEGKYPEGRLVIY
jgi:glycosylphosphatidylinositol transamidase (GPIT) subunit GPI8